MQRCLSKDLKPTEASCGPESLDEATLWIKFRWSGWMSLSRSLVKGEWPVENIFLRFTIHFRTGASPQWRAVHIEIPVEAFAVQARRALNITRHKVRQVEVISNEVR